MDQSASLITRHKVDSIAEEYRIISDILWFIFGVFFIVRILIF